jgi:hypothetical protein
MERTFTDGLGGSPASAAAVWTGRRGPSLTVFRELLTTSANKSAVPRIEPCVRHQRTARTHAAARAAQQEWSITVNEQQNTTDPAGPAKPRHRADRRFGRTVIGLAAVAGLGLAAWAGTANAATANAETSSAATSSAARATPTCSAAALKATFGRQLAGGMNHQGVVITLRNLSGRTCALRGYPGLGLENSAHRKLTAHTHWGNTWYAHNPGKKTLTLKDGQSAEAVVAWTHANTGTSGAVHASFLEITPPGATQHKTLAFPQWVDHGDLSVTALAKHVTITS